MEKDQTALRDINPFTLRISTALREETRLAAKENKRSLNSEILARLEQTFLPSSKSIRVYGENKEESSTTAHSTRLEELSSKLNEVTRLINEIHSKSE